MRRWNLILPLAAFAASIGPASAASASPPYRSGGWHSFSSKKLGFAFRYPSGWRLVRGSVGFQPATQVVVSYQGRTNYQLNAIVLPIKAGPSLTQTMKRFLAYERTATQSTMYDQIRWTSPTLGGQPAKAGVLRPPTEGGVAIADAIYISQWRSRVYEVVLTSNRSPAPSQPSQFPSIYRQILSTWRFI